MESDKSLADLIQEDRPAPARPARIGGHDVLLEESPFGTGVYLLKGDRVLVAWVKTGYREEVAAALLDAVADLMDVEDLGEGVHLHPIDVPGLVLDRAALLGPGQSDFFASQPHIEGRGLQVMPVHRSETAEGDAAKEFWFAMGKGLGIRSSDWTRDPRPRAAVMRVDGKQGGLYRNRNQRKDHKPGVLAAQSVLERDALGLLEGEQLSIRTMHGRELLLHREWDRLCGTLDGEAVSVPRHSAWRVFGPLFDGDEADFDAAEDEPGPMLELRINDEQRGRYDEEVRPHTLAETLTWLRALSRVDGNFLVCCGRSGEVFQLMWQGAEPRLWLDVPDPGRGRSRGRFGSLAEAERMITVLAEEDRVAVAELGDLETI